MPFSLEQQLRLLGPQLFEELCGQLVKKDFPASRHVEGAGGDEGLDIFDGDIDITMRKAKGSELLVWQAKFFRDGVKSGQRKKAQESLRVVAKHQPDFWTLCVPVCLDKNAQKWFQSLQNQYKGITLYLWQADEIVSRVTQDESLLDTYFLRPQSLISRETLDAILSRMDDFISVVDLLSRVSDSVETTPKAATDFYDGTIPDWRDIVQDFDARRERLSSL